MSLATAELLQETELETSSQPMLGSLLDQLLANLQSIESEYAANVSTAVQALMDHLNHPSNPAIERRISAVKVEFERRVQTASTCSQSQRQRLQSEMAGSAGHGNQQEVLLEIAQTEDLIATSEAQIETMIENPSVELSQVIRARTE